MVGFPMRVSINLAEGGYGYTLAPMSQQKLLRIQKDMLANGCEVPPDDVFFQNLEDLLETLDGYVPSKKLDDLVHGWTITCSMDDWVVRHLFGYCSE